MTKNPTKAQQCAAAFANVGEVTLFHGVRDPADWAYVKKHGLTGRPPARGQLTPFPGRVYGSVLRANAVSYAGRRKQDKGPDGMYGPSYFVPGALLQITGFQPWPDEDWVGELLAGYLANERVREGGWFTEHFGDSAKRWWARYAPEWRDWTPRAWRSLPYRTQRSIAKKLRLCGELTAYQAAAGKQALNAMGKDPHGCRLLAQAATLVMDMDIVPVETTFGGCTGHNLSVVASTASVLSVSLWRQTKKGEWRLQKATRPVRGPARRGHASKKGWTFAEGDSPLDYNLDWRAKVQRLALVDPPAGPAPEGDLYFDETHSTTLYGKKNRRLKKPRRVVTPGAGDGVIAFIDFTIFPSVDKTVPYMHYARVRSDHQGMGHMRELVAEFYARYGANARWIDWGDVVDEGAGKLYQEYKDADRRGGVPTTGKIMWASRGRGAHSLPAALHRRGTPVGREAAMRLWSRRGRAAAATRPSTREKIKRLKLAAYALYDDDPEHFVGGCSDISYALYVAAKRVGWTGVTVVSGTACPRGAWPCAHCWLDVNGRRFDPTWGFRKTPRADYEGDLLVGIEAMTDVLEGRFGIMELEDEDWWESASDLAIPFLTGRHSERP